MIPHTQQNTSRTEGDCYRTCVASILELPVKDIPNWMEKPDWQARYTELVGRYGYRLLTIIDDSGAEGSILPLLGGCYAIALGTTKNGFRHACV